MTFTFTYLIYASQSMQFHESRDCGLSYLLLLLTMWQRARLEEALMIIYRMSKYFLLGVPAAGPSQLMQGKSCLFFPFSLPHSYFLSLGGFLKNFFFKLVYYFWLPWVFIAVHGLSLVAANRGFSLVAQASHCSDFSCGAWAFGHASSVVVVHGLRCPITYGILLDQGSNLCPLHWQVDS